MVVATKSTHIGRRFNGRLFFGGDWNEDDQNDGNWSAGTLTFAETIVAAIPRQPDISPPLSTATARWSVYSRTQRGANLDPYLSEIAATIKRPELFWHRKRAGIS